MALSQEQTQGLQDAYKKFRASGMDRASATAKLKEELVKSGTYDKAKEQYLSPNTGVASQTSPLAPVNDQASVNNNEFVVKNGKNLASTVSAPPQEKTYGLLGNDGLKTDSGNPTTPGDVSATPRGSVARDAIAAPIEQKQVTDSTGQIIPQGFTSFDTSKGVESPKTDVKPIIPTVAKPEADQADRTQEILKNLQEGQKNAPQLFQNYDTFKGAYGYDGKPQEEKDQLDAFWQANNKKSADQLIDMAISSQDINPYRKSPEFITAQRIAGKVLDYSKMTAPQLAQKIGMMEADILPGSKAYQVLSRTNPQLLAEAERIHDANRRSGLSTVDENGRATVNRVPDAETSVSDSVTFDVNPANIPTLASALNTKEIGDARGKVSKTRTELDTLYDTIEGVEDDVRNELKGTGATESYVRALISERSKPLMKQVNSLERRYANEAGNLKYLTDAATDSFKYSWQLASEDRKTEREKALLKFKQSLESDGTKTDLVDLGNQKALINKDTGAVIATYDLTKPLTDKFEFRSETDQFGNQVTAIFDKTTGKRVGGGAAATPSDSNYSEAVSYLSRAGYDTTPAIIKSVSGKSLDEIKSMYPEKEGMTTSGKPQTEAQQLSTGFAERIGRSNEGIKPFEKYVASLSLPEFTIYANEYTPNAVKPSKYQQFEQYAREFITSQLRKESGAAISKEEWDTAWQQYFPRPGDSSAVINQKRKSREAAYDNMVRATGLKDFQNPESVNPASTQVSFRNVGSTEDNKQQLNMYIKAKPKEAGPKYNNLGGITYRGADGKEMPFVKTLKKFGIPFEEGGVRGDGGGEGGTYVKFKTVGDGIDGYNLLWKTGKYQKMTLKDALNTWGTGTSGFSKEDLSKNVSDVDKATLSKVKALQISRESPSMFKYLKDNGLLKHL